MSAPAGTAPLAGAPPRSRWWTRPALLFALSSAIWGSTWLAITFQLGKVPASASVCYRFALASVLLAAGCALAGRSLRFPPRTHLLLMGQGLLFFGLNYVAIYKAEEHVASGLVAVLFSTIVFMSLVGTRIAFGTPITARALVGAALGVAGVTLLFLREILAARHGGEGAIGIAYGLAGTALAMGGNLVSMRIQRERLPILTTTAWGMAYGALVAGIAAVATGGGWAFETSLRYVGSLLYLAVFGTIVAFLAYLTLLERVGAGIASYVAVTTPVLAMLLSTLAEGYRWSVPGVLGVVLAIAGNVVVLRAPRR